VGKIAEKQSVGAYFWQYGTECRISKKRTQHQSNIKCL